MPEWPPLEGRYKVGNKESPIAICTMATVDMEFPMDKIAIAGKCVTENMGIEKIVKNTISNPNIRYMIICGKVPMGHFVDNAIVSLIGNGVDPEGRIIRAKGGIPVVKNLSREEIDRFRKQVLPITMSGETDVSRVMEKVEELFEKNPGPMEEFVFKVQHQEKVNADGTEFEFQQDEKGYFIIYVDHDSKLIRVLHFENIGPHQITIEGTKASFIYNYVIKKGMISTLAHAAYLGRELAKAEMALKTGKRYEQDSDLI